MPWFPAAQAAPRLIPSPSSGFIFSYSSLARENLPSLLSNDRITLYPAFCFGARYNMGGWECADARAVGEQTQNSGATERQWEQQRTTRHKRVQHRQRTHIHTWIRYHFSCESYENPYAIFTNVRQPQPFTPMGGDFLHIAIDVSGDGKLPVPPKDISDPLTQVFNFTMFLTSNTLSKNFTISNITTTTPPLADIMNQEPGQTVKHVNFEWPDCLVGDGKEDIGTTARGEYNISIHQSFRLNGSDFYSVFNLPISVTNSIAQFPGAKQLLTKPPPGPLSANGGRMSCNMISNPMMNFTALVNSVNNPPGQPFQDIAIETTPRNDGGQIGGPGVANGNGRPPAGGTAEGQVGSGAPALSIQTLDTLLMGAAMIFTFIVGL
jgi:hypothetical protein